MLMEGMHPKETSGRKFVLHLVQVPFPRFFVCLPSSASTKGPQVFRFKSTSWMSKLSSIHQLMPVFVIGSDEQE